MSITSLLKTLEDENHVQVTPDLEFEEKDAGGISLKGVLQRARAKYLREKKVWKQGKTFSPSTVTYNYCRRIKVAQLADKVELHYDKHPPRVQAKFDIGNALHEMVQGWFWDLGMLKGTFKCLTCKYQWSDHSPKKCAKCGAARESLEFKEVKMKNETHQLSGRCDGILSVDENEDHLFDIKSIAGRTAGTPQMQLCFEDLDQQGPKSDHVVQVNLYLYMSGLRRGHLLYINKNDGRIKTFAIPYNYEKIEPYLTEIEHLLKLAEKLKKNELKPEELPEVCGRKDCPCEKVIVSYKK